MNRLFNGRLEPGWGVWAREKIFCQQIPTGRLYVKSTAQDLTKFSEKKSLKNEWVDYYIEIIIITSKRKDSLLIFLIKLI
mmetsp:Transcript_230/g.648  ORF Transcript_230/g.648 Transcript_230/m.648 type:complete len:80 (+) Transcript_230:405-644(+)